MNNTKITNADLTGKGVVGLPDAPGLSTGDMQAKFDEIALDVLVPKHNGLIDELASTGGAGYIGAGSGTVAGHIADKANPHSVTAAQAGAYTKSETDTRISERIVDIASADMARHIYDNDGNGIVDNSERLGGELPSWYAKTTDALALYTHSKSGTTHRLSGTGNNIKFIASANFADGDMFTVNGVQHTAATTGGEPLEDGCFVSGAAVGCLKNGNTLNFNSGGAGINYNIVCTLTRPTSPSENTIWLESDMKMAAHIFDNVIATALSGRVYINLLTSSSTAKLNLIKSPKIVIGNTTYKRYINANLGTAYVCKTAGTWAQVNAWIYQSGSWIQFSSTSLTIYNAGTSVSGIGGFAAAYNSGQNYSLSLTGGRIVQTAQRLIGTANGSRGDYGLTRIDLTNFKTLTVEVASVSGTPYDYKVGFISDTSNAAAGVYWQFSNWAAVSTFTAAGTKTVNVSSLSGSYYLAISMNTLDSYSDLTSHSISKITLS